MHFLSAQTPNDGFRPFSTEWKTKDMMVMLVVKTKVGLRKMKWPTICQLNTRSGGGSDFQPSGFRVSRVDKTLTAGKLSLGLKANTFLTRCCIE